MCFEIKMNDPEQQREVESVLKESVKNQKKIETCDDAIEFLTYYKEFVLPKLTVSFDWGNFTEKDSKLYNLAYKHGQEVGIDMGIRYIEKLNRKG